MVLYRGGEICDVSTGSGECEVVQTEDWFSWVVGRMVSDEWCVECDSRLWEDVAHFLMGLGEFERDRQMLLEDVCRIVGTREWLDELR